MHLGLKLFASSFRQTKGRTLISILSVTIASGLLFTILAGLSGLKLQENRIAWTRDSFTARPPQLDPSGQRGTFVLGNTEQRVNDQTYNTIQVSPTAKDPASIPGIPSLPQPGQYYLSPALQELAQSLPADQLQDRFSGQLLGKIAPQGLTGPNQLLAIEGVPGPQSNPQADHGTTPSITKFSTQADSQFTIIQIIIAIGAFTVLIPALLLIGNSTKIGASLREQRYAALRLVGASRGQITGIWLIETTFTTIAGLLTGYLFYRAIIPFFTDLSFYAGGFYLSDLILPAIPTIATSLLILALFLATTWWSARSVSLSPLGIRQKTTTSNPRFWRIIPLLFFSSVLAYLTFFVKIDSSAANALTLVFLAEMVGLAVSLLLAGPYLTKLAAKLFSHFSNRAETLIAGKYILNHSSQTFRTVSGVVILIYASSLYFILAGSYFDANLRSAPGTLQPNMVSVQNSASPNAPAVEQQTAIQNLEELQTQAAQIDGVEQVLPVYLTVTSKDDQWHHLINCADAKKLNIHKCSDTQGLNSFDFSNFTYGYPSGLTPADLGSQPTLDGLIIVTDGHQASMNRLWTLLIQSTSSPSSSSSQLFYTDVASTQITASFFSNLDTLAYLGLAITIIISGLNLMVSTINSIMSRKRSFYLLRLSGASLGLLKKSLMLEAVVPLLATILLSIAAGLGFGLSFLKLILDLGAAAEGFRIVAPDYTYYLFIVGSAALCILLLTTTFPTLSKVTSWQENRQE